MAEDVGSQAPLVGRTALVTGASRGIGAAIATELARKGADLLLVARQEASMTGVADGIRGMGRNVELFAADLASEESTAMLVQSIRSKVDRLDILINNAGVLPKAQRAESVTLAEWNRVLALNLTAPWYLACRAKELMTAGGVVVNISSTAASFPSVGLVTYNVSKAALTMLTQGLALEWAREGIRVLGVAPGKVNTDMVAPILEWTQSKKLQPNPLRRIGQPAEIAALVGFLCGDEASYMTGTIVPIDGGELLTSGR